jgi:CubicO group peptidase (beta-lactamase class C family)
MTQTAASVSGFVAPGFEVVHDAFAANFTRRGEVGAAFAAHVDGELVVDLWGGLTDQASQAPWTRDTLTVIFSGTKGVAAAAVLLLLDRGEISLEEPVATYWPELAAAGKEWVTVGDVLDHQAGLPYLEADLTTESLLDPEGLATLLAAQPPAWAGDRRVSYHALTYGWLVGELVRRVSGITVGELVRREIAEPLGVEIWIGLPAEHEPRVSTLCVHESFAAAKDLAYSGPGSRRFTNPPLFDEPLLWNEARAHAAEIPGAGGITDARSMATLYGCLACGGSLGDVKLMSAKTVEVASRERSRGRDALAPESLAFSAGFELQTERGPLGPAVVAFGHGGAGGSCHGAWPRHRVGFSYVMNQMREEHDDDRSRSLLCALYAAVCMR